MDITTVHTTLEGVFKMAMTVERYFCGSPGKDHSLVLVIYIILNIVAALYWNEGNYLRVNKTCLIPYGHAQSSFAHSYCMPYVFE